MAQHREDANNAENGKKTDEKMTHAKKYSCISGMLEITFIWHIKHFPAMLILEKAKRTYDISRHYHYEISK